MIPAEIPAAARLALIAASVALAACRATAQEPLFPTGGEGTAATLRSAFSCPLGRLTDLYTELAEAAEVLDVMAVETEVLVICRTRQERLRAVAEAELELRGLFGLADPAAGAARISIMEAAAGQSPIIVGSCPDPSPVASAGQAGPEAGEPASLPDRPALTAAAAAGTGPLPPESDSAPIAELLSALLTGIADGPEASGGCTAWSWAWTGRDHSRRHSAMLVSPEGLRREVSVGDRLSGRLTVAGITPAGVTVEDGGGNLIRLPPLGGNPASPDGGTDAAADRLREFTDGLRASPSGEDGP